MQNITDAARRRQKYQKLLETGIGINDSIEGEDLVKTLTKVQKLTGDGNAMWSERGDDEANNPSEVVIDIQVLKMNHELIAKSIKTKGMSDFHDDEFINALKELLVDSSDVWQWEKMAPICAEQMKVVSCGAHPLLGAFGDIPAEKEKVAKQRAKRSRTVQMEEKKPETVTKLKQEMKSTQRINDIYKQVLKIYEDRSRRAIPYFELVCHPDNFMLTVENVFQTSFLCREGLLAISDNNNDTGFPTVKPVSKKSDGQINKDTIQAISEINHALWKKCIAKYNIQKPLLDIRRESRHSK